MELKQFTRSIYSPVRVSMQILSTSLMNRGARISAPVSTVAGFQNVSHGVALDAAR